MSFLRPRHRFRSDDFSGGYLETEADSMPPAASPDAKNALLINVERAADTGRPRAVLRKRLGSRLVNPTAMTAGAIVDGLFEFLREGAAGELLAVCNGLLKKFDGTDTFNAVSGGTGFTVGNPVRLLPFKNNALLCDGVQNLRYNGTACLSMGFVAPTSAPTLTATGTGLTGTYEGYAVWYDSVMDHESSPSATSSAVALVNQSRQWAKPTGSPPANVDYWRVYCRRTDTNERNFFRCAQVAIGTASVTESVSDQARTELGPAPNDNDVPPAFALMEEFKGFRLAVKLNSSDLYVSKQFDPESQHPRNVFPVGGKGDSKPVRSIRKYAEECLVQKPQKTYRVVGDKLPFQILGVDSSLGNVSQEAGLEVRGWLYAFDERVGPYRTDLETWEPLADNRVATTIQSVNHSALEGVKAVHVHAYNLIVWTIPANSTRRRTLLAYNYVLDRWLPPITGFEYASLTTFTTTDGALGVYFGDYWGRVYELFSGEIDGPPSGDTSGAITGATAGTITCAAASFYTTGSGLAGMPAAVKSPSGTWQWVRIQSNTGTVLTFDTSNGPELNPVPASDGTWTVYVGAIEWYWFTPRTDHDDDQIKKVGRWLTLEGRVTAESHRIELGLYINQRRTAERSYEISLPIEALIWGVGLWGVDRWGDSTVQTIKKRRVHRSYYVAQLRVSNFYPNQPVVITSYSLAADPLMATSVASG